MINAKLGFGVFVLAVIAIFAFCFSTFGESGSKTPTSLTGTWHQSPNDRTPMNMVAEVTPNHIQIMMHSNVVSGLYWDGTFETEKISNQHKIVSISDDQELSQDSLKTFTYANGEISYEFSMLGKTYTVHMSRGE